MQKRWYAIYTKSRNEKTVADALVIKDVEVYLPLLKTLKQWSDRKKWVEIPLFRSYLFVRIRDPEYFEILKTPGVVRFITFQNERVPIPDQQIEAVKAYLDDEDRMPLPDTHYEPGDTVEITRGTMKGLVGAMVKVQGKQRVIIDISAIGERIFLNISRSQLRKIS